MTTQPSLFTLPAGRTLFTLGYTGLGSVGRLLEIAMEHNAVIADIRLSARSRNPLWNRGNLERCLLDRYVYLGDELGNRNYKNGGAIEIVDIEAGCKRLAERDWSRSDPTPNVILLCVCKDVKDCHRLTVGEALAATLNLPLEHL